MYLLLIFELNFPLIINILSYLLLFLAITPILKIKELLKLLKFRYDKNKIHIYLIVFLFFLLFLISASPITHADSLNYHFSGALSLLNYGHFHKEILPMLFNLVSIGEILIALGLSLKAEQFAGIVQFLTLLSLIPFFTKEKKKNQFFNINFDMSNNFLFNKFSKTTIIILYIYIFDFCFFNRKSK